MTNAEKFQSVFGIYATELWAKPEKDFLIWLNSEAEDEPKRKIGKWIEYDFDCYRCSTCEIGECFLVKENYCPNCGAEMRNSR